MGRQPIQIFRENYSEILADIERVRQHDGTSANLPSTSIDVSKERPKRDVVEELYDRTRSLVSEAEKGDYEGLRTEAYHIIHGCLDYIKVWGSNAPVTAQEREADPTEDLNVTQRPPTARVRELFDDKGDDYEADEVTYLSYCILGHWSIIHEVHKNAQRLYSVTIDEDPKFEVAEDTVFDLCNYALYLLAYLKLPSELSYDWVIHDLQGGMSTGDRGFEENS